MNFFSKIKENPLLSLLIILLILLGIVFVVVLCFENPKRIFNLLGVSEKEQPKYEVLKFLGISMGGILIALQALMSYKRAKAMEDTAKAQVDAAKAQARATEEQARANGHTEQGLRQERLKNAIEHLGDEKDSVRLGGAYEIFHLAEDTEKLRQTVLDILCAHIRQTTSEYKYRKANKSKPSEEVQSLLTLLFVQKHAVFKNCDINLQGSWLKGADLRKARLQGAILTGVYLQKANLEDAHFQGANLTEALLQEADLGRVRLQGAELWWAHLQGTDLSMANLQEADLYNANLQEADLSMANLQGVELAEAGLQGVDLDSANLQGVDLRKAQLQGAFLGGAQMQEAFLKGAHLEGVISKNWSPSISFEDCIRRQVGKETDLSGVIFAGGVTKKDVDSLVEGLSGEKANDLRERLKSHIKKKKRRKLPKKSGAITGAYTEKEAERWIAEYKKAMPKVSEDDS